jgi:hypothetical protein
LLPNRNRPSRDINVCAGDRPSGSVTVEPGIGDSVPASAMLNAV